jgi:hypothetical protein
MEWWHGETNPAAVVVVSADIAVSWEFLGYATHGCSSKGCFDEW